MLRKIIFPLCSSLIMLSSCTPYRSTSNVKEFQTLAAATQFDQIKFQLARSIDNPYDLPVMTTFDTTQLKTTAGMSTNYTRENALSHTDSTQKNTIAFPGLTAGAETQITVNTTSSPKTIEILRDLYTYAIKGEKNWGPEVDKFLTHRPPAYPWLYYSRSGVPSACQSRPCVSLGKYGDYNLFAKSQKAYSDFALSILEGATITGQAVVIAIPGPQIVTPGKTINTESKPKRRQSTNVAPIGKPNKLSDTPMFVPE